MEFPKEYFGRFDKMVMFRFKNHTLNIIAVTEEELSLVKQGRAIRDDIRIPTGNIKLIGSTDAIDNESGSLFKTDVNLFDIYRLHVPTMKTITNVRGKVLRLWSEVFDGLSMLQWFIHNLGKPQYVVIYEM